MKRVANSGAPTNYQTSDVRHIFQSVHDEWQKVVIAVPDDNPLRSNPRSCFVGDLQVLLRSIFVNLAITRATRSSTAVCVCKRLF